VHPSNPVTNLTFLQLRALYRGEILDWSAVGGPGGVPLITSREEGSGTRAGFEATVMGGADVTLNAVVLPTSKAMADYVASHRNAIGYVSTGALTDQVRVVAVEDTLPTPETLRAGAYPLGRVLYLYVPRSPSPAARSFIEFALSPAGQRIVGRHLVPIR
ncbi:MAG: substrate-binding domain-containing protein, partial [Anaerolineae bacterium]|nr:substrate-binding domain-containing protein [Anaerolineae bacterium]